MRAPAGGAPGVRTQGRKGDDGSHTASPPPPCRGTRSAPRACAVLATCLRQRTDSEDAPPPSPPPSPPPIQEMGEDSEETARGHGGGQRIDRNAGGRDERRAVEVKKNKTKDTNAPEQGQIAGADGTRQEPGSTARGAGKGDTPGEESWEGGTNTAANGGARADKSPQKTLVRYLTSGVRGPPRCPYRPHLSAGNTVGYARYRSPAARGGTGLGGGANGPDQEHSPRHVLRFVSCEGLRVGHTVHRGRQETRLFRKDSPETHSVPDPGVGKGRRTSLRRRSICTERVQMDGPYNRVTP